MLKKIEHIIKESAELIIREARRHAFGNVSDDFITLSNQVRRSGYGIIEGYWSSDRCREAVDAIDCELENTITKCHRWDDADRADQRLWYSERMGGLAEEFHSDPFIESFRRAHSGVVKADKLLLAARLNAVFGNKGSGGGWHRDSPHRSQFKAILYLSDVKEENGPFEYLEGSHLVSDSLRMLAKKIVKPNQYRFTEEEIQLIVSSKKPPFTFTASAGTLLLVDTKGIHRGRPISAGTRYAYTQYCFDGKKPNTFLDGI